jgi:hypothetical protein
MTEPQELAPISYDAFRTFLSIDSGRKFPMRQCSKCAIASFLKEVHSIECAVGNTAIWIKSELGAALPDWAQKFVRAVDTKFFSAAHATGAECLAILEEIDGT